MSFHQRKRTRRGRRAALLALAPLALAIGLFGCGAGDEATLSHPDYAPALKSAPPELAKIYANGDAILDGGERTFDRLLRQAKGYPVVVNNWASWCMPCREEFPFFQNEAAKHLDQVAFLGVDSADSRAAAETFLRDHPLPYPSVEAPGRYDFREWTGRTLVGFPNTVFYDASGELVYAKQGGYADQGELAADIRKYALGSG